MFLIRCHRPLSMQTMRTSIGSATAASPSHRRRSLRRRRRHRRRRRRRRPAAFWRAPCGPAGRAIRWPSIRARPSLQVGWLLFIDWFIKKKNTIITKFFSCPNKNGRRHFSYCIRVCLGARFLRLSFVSIFKYSLLFFWGGGREKHCKLVFLFIRGLSVCLIFLFGTLSLALTSTSHLKCFRRVFFYITSSYDLIRPSCLRWWSRQCRGQR